MTNEVVEILLNSVQYYQKKYDGSMKHMDEVFPIEDPSNITSPVKVCSAQQSKEHSKSATLLAEQSDDSAMSTENAQTQDSKFKTLHISERSKNESLE